MFEPSEEVRALAEHHVEILKRRFPNYRHEHAYGILTIVGRRESRLADRFQKLAGARAGILVASFSSSSVQISPFSLQWGHVVVFNYANPEFTDNTISDIASDILKKMEGHYDRYGKL